MHFLIVIHFIFEAIPAFRWKSSQKNYFPKPKKELPLVALFLLRKISFFVAGFPFQSGLGESTS